MRPHGSYNIDWILFDEILKSKRLPNFTSQPFYIIVGKVVYNSFTLIKRYMLDMDLGIICPLATFLGEIQ